MQKRETGLQKGEKVLRREKKFCRERKSFAKVRKKFCRWEKIERILLNGPDFKARHLASLRAKDLGQHQVEVKLCNKDLQNFGKNSKSEWKVRRSAAADFKLGKKNKIFNGRFIKPHKF